MFKCRWYQKAAIEETWAWMRRNPDKHPVIELPTGSGKSIVLAEMMRQALTRWGDKRKVRVLLLTHQKELIEQNHAKLVAMAPELDIGINSASVGTRDYTSDAIFAGIQSVYKDADALLMAGKFHLVFVDEAHLVKTRAAGMYRTFLAELEKANPTIRIIGLTATPYRLEGGLVYREFAGDDEKLFDDVSYRLPVTDLIAEGYVARPLNIGSKCSVNTKVAKISRGDFDTKEMTSEFVSLLIEHLSAILNVCEEHGCKSVLIFATSLDHASAVTEALRSIDKSAEMVDGGTPKKEREDLLTRFQNGDIQFMVNVGVLTTGFDAPNIDLIVLLRATASPGLYVQMVGRGLRVTETKKEFYVLDFGNNVSRHGPLDDICENDEGDQSDKKKKREENKAWECPNCECVNANWKLDENGKKARNRTCWNCDYLKPISVRASEVADDGDLLERSISEFRVVDIDFKVWTKKGEPSAPKTIRVDYVCGMTTESTWKCPEHRGWARSKFEEWFSRVLPNHTIPNTAEEAVKELRNNSERLVIPDKVLVKPKAGSSFFDVKEMW